MTAIRRRDRLYIIAEILEIARTGIAKTRIMGKANLSYPQLKSYLDFLLTKKLLEPAREGGRTLYKTTAKGLEFLQKYEEATNLLEEK